MIYLKFASLSSEHDDMNDIFKIDMHLFYTCEMRFSFLSEHPRINLPKNDNI